MGASPLRDYLVDLSFKVDRKKLREFTSALSEANKSVTTLVTKLSGISLAVGAGVTAFASNLEDLYFAAKKASSTATNMRALGQAAKNFGVEAEDAMGSAQGLARFMRETPGSEGYLAALGIQTRGVNGELRDTTELLVSLGDQLKALPYAQSKQYADLLGISEDTLRIIMDGSFGDAIDHQRKKLKNSGFDQASKDAHKFMKQIRDLQTSLETFGIAVQKALLQHFHVSLKQIGDWLDTNGPRIGERIGEMLDTTLKLVTKTAEYIGIVVDKFVKLDEVTDGLSTKVALLGGLFIALGGPAVLSSLAGLAKAVRVVAVGAAVGAGAAGAGAAAGGGLVAAGAAAGGGLITLLGGSAAIATLIAAIIPVAMVAATAWLAKQAADALLPNVNPEEGRELLKKGDLWGASFKMPADEFLTAGFNALADKLTSGYVASMQPNTNRVPRAVTNPAAGGSPLATHVTIVQHISGTSDPKMTAEQTSKSAARALARNSQGKVQ